MSFSSFFSQTSRSVSIILAYGARNFITLIKIWFFFSYSMRSRLDALNEIKKSDLHVYTYSSGSHIPQLTPWEYSVNNIDTGISWTQCSVILYPGQKEDITQFRDSMPCHSSDHESWMTTIYFQLCFACPQWSRIDQVRE